MTDCVNRTHDPFCYVAIAQLYHLDPFDESEMSVPDAEFASIDWSSLTPPLELLCTDAREH